MRIRAHAAVGKTLIGALFLWSILALASGCTNRPATATSDTPPPPTRPPAWRLQTPESAVRSYLDWTSFAYRMVDSDLASKTVSPDEGVRVDSYIELLKEKSRGIDQHLTAFEIVRCSAEGTRTLVATKETWSYRYFALDGASYITPGYSTSYETTYTLVKQPTDGWVVDGVEAKALDAVH